MPIIKWLLIVSFISFSHSDQVETPVQQSDHMFSVTREHDIQIAVTRGGPAYTGELFTYTEVFSFDLAGMKERERPHSPSAILQGVDSRFYIVDSDQERRTIFVFNNDGEYLDSFGRGGGKPGEFSAPILQTVGKDTLVLFDGAFGRITRFTASGTLIDTMSVIRYSYPWYYNDATRTRTRQPANIQAEFDDYNQTQVTYPISAWRLMGGGHLVLETSQWPRAEAISRAVVYSSNHDTLAVFGTREIQTGTWAFYNRPVPMPGTRPNMSIPGFPVDRFSRTTGPTMRGKAPVRLPYASLPVALYHPPNGVLLSTGTEPILTWYDLEGKQTQRIEIEAEPERVTATDRQIFEQAYREYFFGLDETMQMVTEGIKNYLLLPNIKAFWTLVSIDDAGYYWLRRQDSYVWENGNSRFTYWILSPEGEFLGSTTAPPSFLNTKSRQEWVTPVSISNGYFFTITQDASESGWVITGYHIEPNVIGLVYPQFNY